MRSVFGTRPWLLCWLGLLGLLFSHPTHADSSHRPPLFLLPLSDSAGSESSNPCRLPEDFRARLHLHLTRPWVSWPEVYIPPPGALEPQLSAHADCLGHRCLPSPQRAPARPQARPQARYLGGVSEALGPTPAADPLWICRARLFLADPARQEVAVTDVYASASSRAPPELLATQFAQTVLAAAVALAVSPAFMRPDPAWPPTQPRYCAAAITEPSPALPTPARLTRRRRGLPDPSDRGDPSAVLLAELDRLAYRPTPAPAACTPWIGVPPASAPSPPSSRIARTAGDKTTKRPGWLLGTQITLGIAAGASLLTAGLLVPLENRPAGPQPACAPGSFATLGQENLPVVGWCREYWAPVYGPLFAVGGAALLSGGILTLVQAARSPTPPRSRSIRAAEPEPKDAAVIHATGPTAPEPRPDSLPRSLP